MTKKIFFVENNCNSIQILLKTFKTEVPIFELQYIANSMFYLKIALRRFIIPVIYICQYKKSSLHSVPLSYNT